MQAVLQKLRGKRGASIVLALLFFLICATIGSVVLASASSNIGRLSHMRDEQQDYLTVSSAARLLRYELAGQQYKVVKTVVDGVLAGYDYTEAGGELAAILNGCARDIYDGGTAADVDIGIASSVLGDVGAVFAMDTDYNITVGLRLDDPQALTGERYPMVLSITADKTEHVSTTTRRYEVTVGTDDEGNAIKESRLEITKKTTTTVKWEDPTILKGSAS